MAEHAYKAEVQQLLDLMIHSVYSDREVFLRELISNAADALDKARFLELTRPDLVAAETETPGIRITLDAEKGVITIEDDGIGLTEQEAIDNLGTIARSGTKAFMEQLGQENADAPQLIGKFGLGFYSAFMVADEVEVHSRSAQPDAQPIVWRSKGKGSFELEAGTRTHRGTEIILFMRSDASEFTEQHRLQGVVRKHSNFLTWPIQVDGEQANSGKAIWTKNASEITDEEANEFYRSVAMDWREPALRIQMSVDTPLQFHALLFVPEDRPFDLFQPEAPKGPRLYARRVLIDEHAKELVPDWLRFVRGVVDSEDIQLNVSREMIQKTPVVRKIRDMLTKRVLKELKKLAKKDVEKFAAVWKAFGLLLKEGYYHDKHNFGENLLPLLRFNTTSCEDAEGLRSLAELKESMSEGQDTLWYLTAESREAALASPHLEAFDKKGYEVMLLTDPVDEWLVSSLTEFEEVPLKSVSRGELDLDEEDAEEESEDKARLSEFTPWVKDLLNEFVSDVRPSSRLTDSACVLVDTDDGMTANMERILREANQDVGNSKRALELNPSHPLIKNLAALHEAGQVEAAEPIIRLLYDDALLLDGSARDTAAMGRRLQDMLVVASEAALRHD